MDPTILQSLQEIASLLLIVHDDYLKGVYGNDILASLMELLEDVGLQSKVSVLDAERLRRAVMMNSDVDMGYELFYDWLRGVGQLVCNERDVAGKKALHYLLTHYIIPFASTMGSRAESTRNASNVGVPYFTDRALRVLVEYDSFLVLWYHEIITERSATSRSSNQSLWQQLMEHGGDTASHLSVLGSLTRYTITPDLLTDDQVESTLMLASGASAEADVLHFPSFLYTLELLSEAIPAHKLPGAGTSAGKLSALLATLARNILHRRVFSCALKGKGGDNNDSKEHINVYDDDELPSLGISDEDVLHWLMCANAIQVPHVQIPLVAEFLNALAVQRADYLLLGNNGGRLWKASEIVGLLHAVAQHLVTLGGSPTASPEQEVLFLMRQLPGLFFSLGSDVGDFAGEAALRSLYSPHSAPVLRDAVAEINASLHALWTALCPADATVFSSPGGAANSNNFISIYGTAHAKVYRILDFLVESGLVPVVITTSAFLNACAAVMGEDPQKISDESNISQGRLFDVLYVLVHDHWHVLENLRRKRPLSAPPSKLSDRRPQREQQLFQTFLYLLDFHFPFAPPPPPPPLPAETAAAQEQVRTTPRTSRIPVPAPSHADSSIDHYDDASPPTALRIMSEVSSRAAANVESPSAAAFSQLAVSFNSNKHFDGSPLRQQSSPLPQFKSFFSDHPLRDIAVLLTHYPAASFALSPWTVLELLKLNSASFPPTGYGNPSANTDALLTALLSKFCHTFRVSSTHLSEFFAQYYLTEEAKPLPPGEISAALFKEQSLRSPVLDCLMTDQNTQYLAENASLLKWEYARCVALYRTSPDPFVQNMVTPFISDFNVQHQPQCTLLPIQTARNWAVAMVNLAPEEVDQHIAQMTCLTGNTRRSFSFASFVLFAVRCFTHRLFGENMLPGEEGFAQALRDMIGVFSAGYESTRRALQVSILEVLYPSSSQESPSRAESISEATLTFFNSISLTTASGTSSLGSTPGDGRIPPRPPRALWDAPRFAQFCRDLGLIGVRTRSILPCCQAFVAVAREQRAPGIDTWEASVIPPIPLRANARAVGDLLRAIEGAGSGADAHAVVVAAMCSLSDASSQKKIAQDGLLLEDLLRYGGGAALRSLADHQDYLWFAYSALAKSSEGAGGKESAGAGEVPLNVVCRFFGAASVLRATAVAMLAKRCLHVRLRPLSFVGPTAGSAQKAAEVVTLSYAEFEELCLRAAYLLWETSTAHLHAENAPSRSVLLSQNHLQNAPSRETTDAVETYIAACAARKDIPSDSAGKRHSWGIDFVGPFCALLQSINALPEQGVSRGGAGTAEEISAAALRRSRGSVRFGENTIHIADPAQGPSAEPSPVTPHEVRDGAFSSNGVGSSGDSMSKLTPPLPAANATRRSLSRPAMANSPVRLERKDWDAERSVRDASPTSKMQTSQRIIMSSTERFLLRQESSEQFVVAVDALLVGTKEALWPVYATYCSCGDSLDPGKLSGPNLFTLLSKLGVLTDQTPLSDVGILLHQTAAHALTGPSANAVAMLYESGDYYESPSLTFEEFIVFLCAFSHLRYEGVMLTPDMFRRKLSASQNTSTSVTSPDNWFKQWQEFMGTSNSFRHLLVECVLPILQKQMLLAFPEDARLRDRFCCVFSLEVLIAVEGVEAPLQKFFEHERARGLQKDNSPGVAEDAAGVGGGTISPVTVNPRDEVEISAIITALKRINLIPKVMAESQVVQLIKDVLPEEASKRRAGRNSFEKSAVKHYLLFPQWEWVLSVVAFQAVQVAVEQSAVPTAPEKIPGMVADVIASIAAAIPAEA